MVKRLESPHTTMVCVLRMTAWYLPARRLLAFGPMPRFSTPTVTRILLLATVLVAGCAKPYSQDDADLRLQEALEGAISREVAGHREDDSLQVTPTLDSQVEQTLAPRRAELDGIGPVVARGGLGQRLNQCPHPHAIFALFSL